MRRNHVLSWTAFPERRVPRVTAPTVPTVPRCKSAASAVRRIARHGTPRRSRERTGAYPLTAMGLRRGTTRPPGEEPGACRDQVVARRIVRHGERSASCLTSQAPHGDVGAEWLAGQVSKDTPLPPHATAREHASGAVSHFVRDPDLLEVKATGGPLQLSTFPVPSPAARRGRGIRAIQPPAPISHFV